MRKNRIQLKRKTVLEEIQEIFGDKLLGVGYSAERIDIDISGDMTVEEEQKLFKKFHHFKKHKVSRRPKFLDESNHQKIHP